MEVTISFNISCATFNEISFFKIIPLSFVQQIVVDKGI